MKMPKPILNAIALVPVLLLAGCSSMDFLEPRADPTEFHVLEGGLSADLDTTRVTFLRMAGDLQWDYRVAYHIDRLGGTPGGTVQLRISWAVKDGAGDIRVHEESFYEAKAGGGSNDVDAYVAAIQTVLDAWAGEVAAAIRGLQESGS